MTLTIDTQVLCSADEPEDPAALDVLVLMRTMRDGANHSIAVDHDGHILSEYGRNLRGHARKWWEHMLAGSTRGPKVIWKDGKVSRSHRRELCERLGFDAEDLPFVGVSSRTRSKLLVAHESDYTPEVCAYLADSALGVRVDCAGPAEAECRAAS